MLVRPVETHNRPGFSVACGEDQVNAVDGRRVAPRATHGQVKLIAGRAANLVAPARVRTGLSGAPVILQRNYGTVFMENGAIVADGRPRSRLLGLYCGRINGQ